MKIPSFRRILFNDYPPESRSLVQQLALSINNGFEVINNALNRNISLKDNILCDIKDITVEVDTNGIPKRELILTTSIPNNPTIFGANVIYTQNITNPSIYPISGVTITFTQTSRGIIINHIAGLPANYQFLLRVVFYA